MDRTFFGQNGRMAIQVLGYAATLIVAITQVPQLRKTLQTHDTEGLSTWTYALITLGSALYVPYALAIHSIPVALTNGWLMLVSATILFFILKNHRS